MNVLSPWFLAGAALIVGPILFHLIKRATKDRIRFSATQFLKESPPKLQRKSRIQNPWLLILRCLIVALLAFAFARPFLDSNIPIAPSVSPPNALVIVLDTSASMRREGAWEAAIQKTIDQVANLESQDRLSIISASNTARPIVTFDRWKEWPPNERSVLTANLLNALEPSWQSTRIDDALELAIAELEQLRDNSTFDSKKRVLLISDFQKSSKIAGIAGREWPEDCILELASIQGTQTGNTGLRWLGWTGDESSKRSMRIGIQSSGQLEATEHTLSLFDARSGTALGEPKTVYSSPGDDRMLLLEIPENAEGPFKVELTGDAEPFDNTLFVAEEAPRNISLNYYGFEENAENPKQSAFYLKRATAGWSDPVVSFEQGTKATNATNPSSNVIVIDSELDRDSANTVRSRIEAGSNALMLISGANRIDSLGALLNETGWSTSSTNREDSRLGTIDFQHPAFALFADPRFSDFSRIRFWHTFSVNPPDTTNVSIIASYDDGAPAVLEATVGEGTVTVWIGDWAPQKSQWALSSKFVPWLQRLFEISVGGPDQPNMAELDEVATLFASNQSSWKPIDANTFNSDSPTQPGLYQLQTNRTERWVAFNTPIEESEWDTHPIEDWERLGAPLDNPFAKPETMDTDDSDRRFENAVELESQQQLWRWMIIAVAAMLAIESLIAKRLQTRKDGTAA